MLLRFILLKYRRNPYPLLNIYMFMFGLHATVYLIFQQGDLLAEHIYFFKLVNILFISMIIGQLNVNSIFNGDLNAVWLQRPLIISLYVLYEFVAAIVLFILPISVFASWLLIDQSGDHHILRWLVFFIAASIFYALSFFASHISRTAQPRRSLSALFILPLQIPVFLLSYGTLTNTVTSLHEVWMLAGVALVIIPTCLVLVASVQR